MEVIGLFDIWTHRAPRYAEILFVGVQSKLVAR
jgi:hypothetical protein